MIFLNLTVVCYGNLTKEAKTRIKSEFLSLSYGRESDKPQYSQRKTVRVRRTRRVTSVAVQKLS